MKGKCNITISTKGSGVKIYINGLLHIWIRDINDLLGIQSWKQGKDHYCIEYYLREKKFISAYNNVEKWSKILELLNTISGE